MRTVGFIVGVCTFVYSTMPAYAHDVVCKKRVNGEEVLELSSYPAELVYEMTVKNNTSFRQLVTGVEDPLLALAGFVFEPLTPFWLSRGKEVTDYFDLTISSFEDCLWWAQKDGKEDKIIDNEMMVKWGKKNKSFCSAKVVCKKPPVHEEGRMTGGGSVFTAEGVRVTHGFQLRCDPDDHRQNLQINWGRGNQFHLLDLQEAVCTDDPNIDPLPRPAPFDTFYGFGSGRLNRGEGFVEFIFTDAGEPGDNDMATIIIYDANMNIVLSVSGTLNRGNHQAHP